MKHDHRPGASNVPGCWACIIGAPTGDNHGDQAKTICAQCPVAAECGAWACLTNEDDGIWGGMGNDRRRRPRRFLRTNRRMFARVIQEELAELRRLYAEGIDARPKLGRRPCPRCPEVIPSGTWPPDRNGEGAVCGRPVTYNRGCRCERCRWAAAKRGMRFAA